MAAQVQPRLITIKKYGNRRLYDTDTSRYITLEELAERICAGDEVRVVDARTAEDLTQATLVQIVLESRGAGRMLPTPLLIELIRLGDGALAEFLGTWMLWAFEGFASMRRAADKAQRFGGGGGMASLPWLGMMPGLSAWSGLGAGVWRGARGRKAGAGENSWRRGGGKMPDADSDDTRPGTASTDASDHVHAVEPHGGARHADLADHADHADLADLADHADHAGHDGPVGVDDRDDRDGLARTRSVVPGSGGAMAELAALRRELDALRARIEAASGDDAALQHADDGDPGAAGKRPPAAGPA